LFSEAGQLGASIKFASVTMGCVPAVALGQAGRVQLARAGPAGACALLIRRDPAKAVTNQVTTGPGIASRSTTCHDSTPPV
jgi:hypothetical protein